MNDTMPHANPNQPRVCYVGKLTHEEAQAKLGDRGRVLEIRPAKCCDPVDITRPLVDATEVIFAVEDEETAP